MAACLSSCEFPQTLPHKNSLQKESFLAPSRALSYFDLHCPSMSLACSYQPISLASQIIAWDKIHPPASPLLIHFSSVFHPQPPPRSWSEHSSIQPPLGLHSPSHPRESFPQQPCPSHISSPFAQLFLHPETPCSL